MRLLSIREVEHLNERKLQQALLYAVRPSRPVRTPRLQGLYVFGSKSARPLPQLQQFASQSHTGITPSETVASHQTGVVHTQGAQLGAQWSSNFADAVTENLGRGGDKWYQKNGTVLAKVPTSEWATTMLACQKIISFDAVLCRGPRHFDVVEPWQVSKPAPWYLRPSSHLPPRIGTHSLGYCAGCGASPEGFSKCRASPMEQFPLLAPPPMHSSTARVAKMPFSASDDELLVRCRDCLLGRYCESCAAWWCEICYEIPIPAMGPLGHPNGNAEIQIKVHMGLCVEYCLVPEMMTGSGSNGMWG